MLGFTLDTDSCICITLPFTTLLSFIPFLCFGHRRLDLSTHSLDFDSCRVLSIFSWPFHFTHPLSSEWPRQVYLYQTGSYSYSETYSSKAFAFFLALLVCRVIFLNEKKQLLKINTTPISLV